MKLLISDFKPTPLEVTLIRSKRKTLAISVYPDQSVEAISPLESSPEEISGKILKRSRWIKRQQKYFKTLQAQEQSQLSLSGSEIYYLGRQYRLKYYTCDQNLPNQRALLKGKFLEVPSPDSADSETTRNRISDWYRWRANDYLQKRFVRQSEELSYLDLPASKLRIALMKTRWGSCTAKGSITLNPLLILASSNLIDYVIVHELCHLKYPNHGKKFVAILSQVLPDWKSRKAQLDTFGAKLKSLPSPFY